jgi:hypothetical protein
MKLIYLKSALKSDTFDVSIGIEIPFSTVSVTIEPGRSLLTVRYHELFDIFENKYIFLTNLLYLNISVLFYSSFSYPNPTILISSILRWGAPKLLLSLYLYCLLPIIRLCSFGQLFANSFGQLFV